MQRVDNIQDLPVELHLEIINNMDVFSAWKWRQLNRSMREIFTEHEDWITRRLLNQYDRDELPARKLWYPVDVPDNWRHLVYAWQRQLGDCQFCKVPTDRALSTWGWLTCFECLCKRVHYTQNCEVLKSLQINPNNIPLGFRFDSPPLTWHDLVRPAKEKEEKPLVMQLTEALELAKVQHYARFATVESVLEAINLKKALTNALESTYYVDLYRDELLEMWERIGFEQVISKALADIQLSEYKDFAFQQLPHDWCDEDEIDPSDVIETVMKKVMEQYKKDVTMRGPKNMEERLNNMHGFDWSLFYAFKCLVAIIYNQVDSPGEDDLQKTLFQVLQNHRLFWMNQLGVDQHEARMYVQDLRDLYSFKLRSKPDFLKRLKEDIPTLCAVFSRGWDPFIVEEVNKLTSLYKGEALLQALFDSVGDDLQRKHNFISWLSHPSYIHSVHRIICVGRNQMLFIEHVNLKDLWNIHDRLARCRVTKLAAFAHFSAHWADMIWKCVVDWLPWNGDWSDMVREFRALKAAEITSSVCIDLDDNVEYQLIRPADFGWEDCMEKQFARWYLNRTDKPTQLEELEKEWCARERHVLGESLPTPPMV
jgi:hypothetical protein